MAIVLASSIGVRSSRTTFSIRASSSDPAPSTFVSISGGILARPASCAARQRRSPAISSYPLAASGRTIIGCRTPRSRIESAASGAPPRRNACGVGQGSDGCPRSRGLAEGRLAARDSRGVAAWHASARPVGSSTLRVRLGGLIARSVRRWSRPGRRWRSRGSCRAHPGSAVLGAPSPSRSTLTGTGSARSVRAARQ